MSDRSKKIFLDAGVTCPECLTGEYPCEACFKEQIAKLAWQNFDEESADSSKTETVKTDSKAKELRAPRARKSFQSGSQPRYQFMEVPSSSEEAFSFCAQFETESGEDQFLGGNLSSAAPATTELELYAGDVTPGAETQDARKRAAIPMEQAEAKRLCVNGAIPPLTGESAMEEIDFSNKSLTAPKVVTILKPVIPPNLSASYNNFLSPTSTSTVPLVTTSVTPDVEKSIPTDFHTTQKFHITDCPHCGTRIDFNQDKTDETTFENISLDRFLLKLGLDHLQDLFEKEEITLDVLADLGHEELKDIGVRAYGPRHKLIKGVGKLFQCLTYSSSSSSSDE